MSTKDEIQTNINERLLTDATKIEGGVMQDIIGSVAYELANIIDTRIEPVLDNAFVSTADEEHLILRGNEFGIERKDATNAIVFAKITKASPNFLITTDVSAKTKNGVTFSVEIEATTDENGEALVKMVCLEKGEIGNIAPNSLVEFCDSYQGLVDAEITNEEKGYDGFEQEEIEEYRERILEYMKDDACNSNISDYIFWAKSISGVKNVVVKDAFTAGAGCVEVYISALNNEIVSEELLQAVLNKIQIEQIVNASVKVLPLEYFKINVSADISLLDGSDIEEIKANFRSNMEKYLDTNPDFISYLFITNLFFENPEILDVTNYKLNDAKTSIVVDEYKVPVLGEVVLNVI